MTSQFLEHQLLVVTTRDLKAAANSLLTLAEAAYWAAWNGQDANARAQLEQMRQVLAALEDLCDAALDEGGGG